MKPLIFIVDDEARMVDAIAVALERTGYRCEKFANAEAMVSAFQTHRPDVVVADWRMPGMDGLALMQALHAMDAKIPVILITAYGDVPSAVSAMRQGAFDYVTKPFDNDELRTLVARALEVTRLQRENHNLRGQISQQLSAQIVAESESMKSVLALLERAAPSKAPILVHGESGTGKELVARRVHGLSDRVAQPFIAVNCKAFAEGVLESELFGHERGAFTGANVAREGCFERANGGTLFLDEIGEISLEFQAKLLRVLQESEVLRVGGSAARKIDVRVVAATNRDLKEEVSLGKFREDLFFRLNVIPVHLAPLRQRRDDILPLAQRFLARHSREAGRTLELSPESQIRLSEHHWRGNVRELENAIERAVVLARTNQIVPEDLLLDVAGLADRSKAPTDTTESLQACLDRASTERITATLSAHQGRRNEAAAALGVDRTTLYRLMKRLGID